MPKAWTIQKPPSHLNESFLMFRFTKQLIKKKKIARHFIKKNWIN